MSQLREVDRDSIIKALKRVGANAPCPRCGNTKFELLGEYDYMLANQGSNGSPPPGNHQAPSLMVPSVLVGCEQCGYLSAHGLGVLGVLPPDEESR
jgi:hypothetical protein